MYACIYMCVYMNLYVCKYYHHHHLCHCCWNCHNHHQSSLPLSSSPPSLWCCLHDSKLRMGKIKFICIRWIILLGQAQQSEISLEKPDCQNDLWQHRLRPAVHGPITVPRISANESCEDVSETNPLSWLIGMISAITQLSRIYKYCIFHCPIPFTHWLLICCCSALVAQLSLLNVHWSHCSVFVAHLSLLVLVVHLLLLRFCCSCCVVPSFLVSFLLVSHLCCASFVSNETSRSSCWKRNL